MHSKLIVIRCAGDANGELYQIHRRKKSMIDSYTSHNIAHHVAGKVSCDLKLGQKIDVFCIF